MSQLSLRGRERSWALEAAQGQLLLALLLALLLPLLLATSVTVLGPGSQSPCDLHQGSSSVSEIHLPGICLTAIKTCSFFLAESGDLRST